MDGVATPIIGRPRPLPGHDTPNPAYHPHTLNYEEPDNTPKHKARRSGTWMTLAWQLTIRIGYDDVDRLRRSG